jgi:hypothetical protein
MRLEQRGGIRESGKAMRHQGPRRLCANLFEIGMRRFTCIHVFEAAMKFRGQLKEIFPRFAFRE